MTFEINPSRLQLDALMAMVPQAAAVSTTPEQAKAQLREVMQRAADLYQGLSIGNSEGA